MAVAALASNDRWGFERQDRHEAQATGRLQAVTGVKATTKSHDTRTKEQRRADVKAEAEKLGVSSRFFL